MAEDQAGNTGAWATSPADFTLDNTAPAVAITAPAASDLLISTQSISWTTSDLHTALVEVELSVNGGSSWTTLDPDAPDTGSFALDTTPFADASSCLARVRATDLAGNRSAWAVSGAFGIDNDAPTVALTSPVGGEAWGGTRQITWTEVEEHPDTVRIEVSTDGVVWTVVEAAAPDSGSYSWDTTPHADGPIRVRVQATDQVGRVSNWSTCATYLTVDNTAPQVSLVSPVGGEFWSGKRNVTWNTTDDHPATAHIEISSDSGNSWTTLASGVADTGSHLWDTYHWPVGTTYRLRVTVSDQAGNTSTPSASSLDFSLSHLWIKEQCYLGSATAQEFWASGAAVHSSGACFFAGTFGGSVDFRADYGGSEVKTPAGLSDVFVLRIDSDGSFAWVHRIGGSGYDRGHSVAVDGAGDAYVTGHFHGTVNFAADWGGTDAKTSTGQYDAFVTKVLADGSYGWTRVFGGAQDDVGQGVTTCPSGQVYVCGMFNGAPNFAADWGMSDVKTSVGSSDIFVTRIGSDGSYGWTRQIGPASPAFDGVACDPSGNVLVAGGPLGTINFAADWGSTDSRTGAASVTKIGPNGAYVWTRCTPAQWSMGGIAVDGAGNAFLPGYFSGTVNFEADFGGSDIRTSAGSFDICLTKLASDGSYGWTRCFGGSGMDWRADVAVDGASNVYLTGLFTGTVNFESDWAGTDARTSSGSLAVADGFLTKIAANGSYGWTLHMIGSGSCPRVDAIAASGTGDLHMGGYFNSNVDLPASDWGVHVVKNGVPSPSSERLFFLHARR